MTLKNMVLLAGKYLGSQFRRHIFIIIVLGFSFGVSLNVTTLMEGMERNVFQAAENHYGGHVFVFGFDKPKYRIKPVAEMLKEMEKLNLHPTKIALRTLSYADGILHFAGRKMKQKYVFGMDWDGEKDGFRGQLFTENAFPEDLGEDGIIVSAAIADDLHARRGDDVILETTTKDGQKNTGTFVIRGIIRDKTIFGYFKCYVDRRRLNELIGFDPPDCSWIGLYFADHGPEALALKADAVYAAFKDRYSLSPPAVTREEFDKEFLRPYTALRYPIFTLYAYISQVSDLLTAVKLIGYFLFVTMIVIAIASMSVSMRLLLHERAREIGTLRVMGLNPAGTQLVLVTESIMVFAIALSLGFALSILFNWIWSLFSYDWIPGFEIFLDQGRLTAAYTFGAVIINLVLFFITTIPAAWLAVIKISRSDLVKVLSGETF